MRRGLIAVVACMVLGACAAQTPSDSQRAAGDIAPDAHPFTPTQADPVNPVTGMTDRSIKAP